jgi:CheY-like chemotaxis protein
MNTIKAEVIIIDDYAQNRLLLEMMLDKWQPSLHITEAENGLPVIDMIKSSPYHNMLLLLDLQMPVMDGYAFLDAWQHEKNTVSKNVTIIVVSATPFAEFKLRPQFGQQHDYLEKPVSAAELSNVINTFLKRITEA